MKKIVLILFGILFFCNNVLAGGTCGTNCTWNIDGDVLTISGDGQMESTPWRNDPDKDLIKSVVVENGITSIRDSAFYNMSSVTGEIKIPNSVTSIGQDAFSGMSNVTSLVIPDSVTSIGNRAFYNMSSVTGELKIPEGVTSIGDNAFWGMSSVTGELTIPEGVTSIGSNAFWGMKNVTSLVIPDSVTSIGYKAFTGMSSVTGEIKIPDGVTSIEDETFFGMNNVTSLIIPDSVTSIGNRAFYNMNVSSITCSEDNLLRYIEANGGLKNDTEILCTSSDCENALKGTKYANLIGNVVYPRKEVGQSDGSVAIYKKGKLVGFKKKRIYTVDEAEFLSKPTGNTFKVRYK